MKKWNFEFPGVIYTLGGEIRVIGDVMDLSKSELLDGNFYVYKGKVYQYRDELPEYKVKYPCITHSDDEFITLDAIDDAEIDFQKHLERTKLIRNVSEHTDEDANFMQGMDTAPSTSIYVPNIGEKDDFLKKLIKTVFLIKRVATTKYRKKMSKTYAFSNLFQGLNSDTKVSTTVWQTWIEMLGIDCLIILKDSGADKDDPINDYIVYKSRNDSITIVDKDEIDKFLSKNL